MGEYKYKQTTWIGGKTIGTADVMNNIEEGLTVAHDMLNDVSLHVNKKVHYYSEYKDKTIQELIDMVSEGDTIIINQNVEIDYQITIDKRINFICESNITYNGVKNRSVIRIAPTKRLNNIDIKIRLFNNNTYDWNNKDFVGCELINVYTSKIQIDCIEGFYTGVLLRPNAGGNVYNEYTMQRIYNCKNSIVLSNINGGWTNQNTFKGGFRIGCLSTIPTTENNRVGIHITSEDGLYTNNNSNTFIAPSFELGEGEELLSNIPIKLDNGSDNNFISIRVEMSCNYAVVSDSDGQPSHFSFTYCNAKNLFKDTGLRSVYNNLDYRHLYKIYDSGEIYKNVIQYNSSRHQIHGINTYELNSTGVTGDKHPTNTTVNDDKTVSVGKLYGVGVDVDTSTVKTFKIYADSKSLNRFVVVCYDEQGVQIKQDGKILSGNFYYTSSLGSGVYKTGSDSNGFSNVFTVADDVEKITIMFYSGDSSNLMKIKSFKVYSFNKPTTVYYDSYANSRVSKLKPSDSFTSYALYQKVYNDETKDGSGWLWNGTSWIDC